MLRIKLLFLLWVPTAAWVLPTSTSTECRNTSNSGLRVSACKIRAASHPRLRFRDHPRTTVALSGASLPLMDVSPFVVAGVALGLGVAAQGFINQMLEGDQGLGAFLKDGSGYNRSGFRGPSSNNEEAVDPLPWLKLPRLDFVEVAGQPSRLEEEALMKRLETLRMEMNKRFEQGRVEEATAIRDELETMMREVGIEYNADR